MTSTRRRLKDFCHHPHSKLCQSHGSETRPGGGRRRCISAALQKTRVLSQPSPTEASTLWDLACQQPDPQPCWQEGSLHSTALCPACRSRSGAGTGVAREPAPRCKRRSCHPVTGGCGISFDRKAMAWNRLWAGLLCLRQSAC